LPQVDSPSERSQYLLLTSASLFARSRRLSLAACRCIFRQVQTRTVDGWILKRIENVVPFPRSVNHLERKVCDSFLCPLIEKQMSLKSTFLVESGEVPFASEARLFAVIRVSASVEARSRGSRKDMLRLYCTWSSDDPWRHDLMSLYLTTSLGHSCEWEGTTGCTG